MPIGVEHAFCGKVICCGCIVANDINPKCHSVRSTPPNHAEESMSNNTENGWTKMMTQLQVWGVGIATRY